MNKLDFRAFAGDPEDEMFVISNWSRAFKHSRAAGIIADEDWPTVMHAQIRKLLARADVLTVLCVEKDDPSFLYGFIAATPGRIPPVVHFVYVKESFRRARYARALFRAVAIEPSKRFSYSCWVPLLHNNWVRDRIPLAKHVPEYARIPGYVEQARSTEWKR
jgi:hypothetical protein